MNGKLAKTLRRMAEDATVGRPNIAYDPERQARFFTDGRQTRLTTKCTRKVYKNLKRINRAYHRGV